MAWRVDGEDGVESQRRGGVEGVAWGAVGAERAPGSRRRGAGLPASGAGVEAAAAAARGAPAARPRVSGLNRSEGERPRAPSRRPVRARQRPRSGGRAGTPGTPPPPGQERHGRGHERHEERERHGPQALVAQVLPDVQGEDPHRDITATGGEGAAACAPAGDVRPRPAPRRRRGALPALGDRYTVADLRRELPPAVGRREVEGIDRHEPPLDLHALPGDAQRFWRWRKSARPKKSPRG